LERLSRDEPDIGAGFVAGAKRGEKVACEEAVSLFFVIFLRTPFLSSHLRSSLDLFACSLSLFFSK
jgi:hypothetical protein